MLVLLAGGAYSVQQGLHELNDPQPVQSPVLSVLVLAIAAIFEAISFTVGYRQYRKVALAHRIPGAPATLVRFIQWSKDPGLYETLLADGAALVGIAIAIAGIVANAYFGYLCGDGAASLAIGLILICHGIVILVATKSLMAGEAAAPTLLHDLRRGLREQSWSDRVANVSTLHLGPDFILVAVDLLPAKGGVADRELAPGVERHLKSVDSRISDVVFRFATPSFQEATTP